MTEMRTESDSMLLAAENLLPGMVIIDPQWGGFVCVIDSSPSEMNTPELDGLVMLTTTVDYDTDSFTIEGDARVMVIGAYRGDPTKFETGDASRTGTSYFAYDPRHAAA